MPVKFWQTIVRFWFFLSYYYNKFFLSMHMIYSTSNILIFVSLFKSSNFVILATLKNSQNGTFETELKIKMALKIKFLQSFEEHWWQI